MGEIETIVNLDWKSLIVAFILCLSLAAGFFKAIEVIFKALGLETKRMRESKLLTQTADNLSLLQQQYKESVNQSIKHDEKIEKTLNEFASEIKSNVCDVRNQMQEFASNRIHDREQSFKIQRELTDSIKAVADGGVKREQQIDALMAGTREMLGAEIDRRFEKYVALQGIPANEIDEFVSLHTAYKGCKGNHSRDEKYDYAKNHLGIISK